MEVSNLIFPLGVIVVIAICAFAYIIYNMNSKINKLTQTQISLSQTLQYLVSNSMRQLQAPGVGVQPSHAQTVNQLDTSENTSTYENVQPHLQNGGSVLSDPMPKIDVSDNSASESDSDSDSDSCDDNISSSSDNGENSESEASDSESNTESESDSEDDVANLQQTNIQHIAIGQTDNVVSVAAIVDMTNALDMTSGDMDSNDIDKIININWNQHQQETGSATITEIVNESDNSDNDTVLDDGLYGGFVSSDEEDNLDEQHNEDEAEDENENVKTETENETVSNEHEEQEIGIEAESKTEAEVATSPQNKNASSVEAFNNFLISVRKKDQDHNNSKAMRVEEMRKLVVEKNLCSEEEAKRIKKRKLAEMLNLK